MLFIFIIDGRHSIGLYDGEWYVDVHHALQSSSCAQAYIVCTSLYCVPSTAEYTHTDTYILYEMLRDRNGQNKKWEKRRRYHTAALQFVFADGEALRLPQRALMAKLSVKYVENMIFILASHIIRWQNSSEKWWWLYCYFESAQKRLQRRVKVKPHSIIVFTVTPLVHEPVRTSRY